MRSNLFFTCMFFFIAGCFANFNNSMSRSYKGSICYSNIECQELLGLKSLCISDECQCIPYYHINNNNICIRDRGLKEICTSSDECYWGPEMVDKIECYLGVCSCVQGYVPDKGKICVRYFQTASSASSINLLPLFVYIFIHLLKRFIVLQ